MRRVNDLKVNDQQTKHMQPANLKNKGLCACVKGDMLKVVVSFGVQAPGWNNIARNNSHTRQFMEIDDTIAHQIKSFKTCSYVQLPDGKH